MNVFLYNGLLLRLESSLKGLDCELTKNSLCVYLCVLRSLNIIIQFSGENYDSFRNYKAPKTRWLVSNCSERKP